MLSEWVLSPEGEDAVRKNIESRWASGAEAAGGNYDSKKAYVALEARIGRDSRPGRRRSARLLRYALETAAAVAIVMCISYLAGGGSTDRPDAVPQIVEIYNPKGLRTTVTLPDNSRVTLNSDTRIAYTDRFEGPDRTVKLDGEAFFDVEKDASRPFIVETGSVRMTVLGTSFNVRSYTGDREFQATLIEGSLRVDVGKQARLLDPGTQITVDRESNAAGVKEVDTEKVTGWMDGRLYFNSMLFSEIARVLERTFSVGVEIADEELGRRVFNGKFERGESLGQILEIMQSSVPFKNSYDKETNIITIR